MRMPRAFKWLAKSRESGWAFTWGVCIPYVLFLVFMHVHHEMWRDEVHAWTLARLANGFWDLVTGDRIYEGHPPLWFWYLHVWTWFIQAAEGIQIATVTAAAVAAILLVRFAPFPRFLKVVLLFSYYFGYEYSVMSRNYVLGWLLVCLFCALYHPARIRHLALALALALMALTSFYGLAMSVFLLGFYVLDQIRFSFPSRADLPPRVISVTISPRVIGATGIVGIAVVFFALYSDPPDPNPFAPGFVWDSLTLKAVPRMLFRVTTGYLPWSAKWVTDFWWHSQDFWEPKILLSACVGAGILVWALLALYPSWRLMVAYAGCIVGIQIFEQIRHEGGARHWGHFFMFFVACAWLRSLAHPRRSKWPATLLILGAVAFQTPTFVAYTVVDTREVFSGGRDTAAFIRRAGLQDLPMVAGPDFLAVTVAGYLRKPFYACETDEINETVVFHGRRRRFSTEDLLNKAVSVSREFKRPVLLVSNQPVPPPPPGVTCADLFSSRPGTVTDEVFHVYRLEAR